VAEYRNEPEPRDAKQAIQQEAVKAAELFYRRIDERKHLRLSLTALFGWVVGGLMFFTGFIMLGRTETIMHSIYQVICISQGSLLIVAGSIAQHTKKPW